MSLPSSTLYLILVWGRRPSFSRMSFGGKISPFEPTRLSVNCPLPSGWGNFEYISLFRVNNPLAVTSALAVYTMNESLITVRVPKELKKRMRESRINWSEELRRAIKAKLEADSKKTTEVELEKLLKSVKPGFSTLQAIKEARRHG